MSKVQSPNSHSESKRTNTRRDEHPPNGNDNLAFPKVPESTRREVSRSAFALTVVDLRKSFLLANEQRLEVLRGASFSAKAGESVAITGASGAGKSTLLHLLGGVEEIDHGSVTAGGFSIDAGGSQELVRFRNHDIGFVFQFHHLLNDLSAVENVMLPLRIKRVSQREAAQRGYEILEEVGINRDSADTLVTHLSGGEQQRVAVCRALITRPRLVLADEPTGNLDEAAAAQIAQLLLSYTRTHHGILIIATHNQDIAQLCSRQIVLSDGRLHDTSD